MDVLVCLFRAAWEVKAGPAVVYGPGTNKLPMVHVDDLAAYIAAAASEEVRCHWIILRPSCSRMPLLQSHDTLLAQQQC